MASLLEELFHDLGRRATEIAEELRKCASTVPSEVEAYRAKMESRAARASALAEASTDAERRSRTGEGVQNGFVPGHGAFRQPADDRLDVLTGRCSLRG